MFTRNVVLVDKKMKVLIPPKAEGSGMTSLTVVETGMAGQAMEAILGMADEIMEDVKRKAAKGEPYVSGNMLRPVAKADRSLRLNGNY